jgi:hypothetical protein
MHGIPAMLRRFALPSKHLRATGFDHCSSSAGDEDAKSGPV